MRERDITREIAAKIAKIDFNDLTLDEFTELIVVHVYNDGKDIDLDDIKQDLELRNVDPDQFIKELNEA